MKKTEFDYDFPNMDDIFEEKIDFSQIFHFSLVQRVLEGFIKKQNAMNKKLNDLEIKFDTWSLRHDIEGGTENSNKTDNKIENKIENVLNNKIENEVNNKIENESDINNEEIKKESEKNIEVDNINKEIIEQIFEEKMKELNKKIKKFEAINKEMSQRIILNNKQNTNFVESSTEKINQININFKNLDTNLKGKDRIINNKIDNLVKKIESIENSIEENNKTAKNLNPNIIYLQKLKNENILQEFYNYRNINDKEIKDIKNLIDEKIKELKNNLFGKDINNLDNQTEHKDLFSPVNELQLNDSINELKNFFVKNISDTNKSYKKAIEELNITKINQDLLNIQNELKEKIQTNLLTINVKIEDLETGFAQLKSKNIENNKKIEYTKENLLGLNKNVDYLTIQISRLNQIESQKEKKITDFLNNEGITLFIKKDLYEEDISKIIKKMEKIVTVNQENLTKINSIEKSMKFFITDKEIKNIEHLTLNKIQEFRIIAEKKFMDKKEGIKSLKLLGVQIKNINEYLNLNNSNNYSVDKISLNNSISNYICPLCDNNIVKNKNNNNNHQCLYRNSEGRQGSKNYRMGQGFSHMLKLINNDLMKSAEKISDEINIENIYYNYEKDKENFNKSCVAIKSLPRINSQKNFSIINNEAKNNNLDSSNITNNISIYYNNNNENILKNETLDKIFNAKLNHGNKINKQKEKISPNKVNKSQIVTSKLKNT